MATTRIAPRLPAKPARPLSTWLLKDQPREMEGPYEPASRTTSTPGGR